MVTNQRYPDTFLGPWLNAVALLNSWREGLFDCIFYDTDNLTQEDVKNGHWLYNLGVEEGHFFVVQPSGAGSRVEHIASVEELVCHYASQRMAVALPGVASSAVGAVSFARTVANGLQRPTIAIVTGYGWSDLRVEALGGWFLNLFLKAAQHSPLPVPMLEKDAERLLEILQKHPRIDTIVGHSKGSGVIMNTLKKFGEAEQKAHEDLQVITFGCMIVPPSWLKHINQYMGAFLDPLGLANTSVVFWRTFYQDLIRWRNAFPWKAGAVDALSREHVEWLPLCGHRIGSTRAGSFAEGNEFTPLRRGLLQFVISQPVDAEALLARHRRTEPGERLSIPAGRYLAA